MIRSTLVAIALVILAVASPAAAGTKIALTAIEDDDDGKLREAVVEAIEGDELSLISEKKTTKAIREAGGGDLLDMSEKKLKKLGKTLEVDAIVWARYGREGGSKVLKFRLWVNGRRLKGFSVLFSNPRSKKFKRALHDKMVEKLVPAAPGEDEEDPIAKGTKKGDKGDKTKGDKTKGDKVADKGDKKPKGDEDEGDGESEGDGEDDEKPRKGSKKTAKLDDEGEDEDDDATASVTVKGGKRHTANRVAVRLDIGGSFSARRLSFTTRADLPREEAPQPFNQSPVGGARFELELYPLAFSNPTSFAAGLGIAAEYDKVVSSKVAAADGPEGGTSATVNQQIYSFGVRYRIPLGSSATSPSITLGGNYGRRTFQVNNGFFMDRANLDLPDTDYKYLSPLLGFRIPFTANIALFGGGEAMLVRSAGPIQEGTSYGRAKVFGLDAAAGLDFVFGNRFAVRLAGEFVQIGYSFTGGGELARNRDGDPDTIDIGGALDRSFGGSMTLGVLY